jgi:FixJ family two-component response regulator
MKVKRYDVLITDLRLGGIDGLDVAGIVRIAAPTTRVVLITAYGSPEVEARARACGVFRLLSKPVEGQLIADVVKEATSSAKTHQPLEDGWKAS